MSSTPRLATAARTIAAAAFLALPFATSAMAQQAPIVITPPINEPTSRTNVLMAVPGTVPQEQFSEGLSFDLFGEPIDQTPRCQERYDIVDGQRQLVSVSCSD